MFDGCRPPRPLLQTSEALENSRSTAQELADAPRYACAIEARVGKVSQLFLHHFNGVKWLLIAFLVKQRLALRNASISFSCGVEF
jgi:hypothetical protein